MIKKYSQKCGTKKFRDIHKLSDREEILKKKKINGFVLAVLSLFL